MFLFFFCLNVVTKLFELIQLAPDRNLVAAAPDSQQNLMRLGKTTAVFVYQPIAFFVH